MEKAMNEIWNKRLKAYQSTLLRYSKYVFNDHFVLALLFFVGGLGLAYSNFVKALPLNILWWEKPILIVILFLLLKVGKLTSLLVEADSVFLLPKDYEMKGFLQLALKHSSLIASVIQLGFIVVLSPFILQGIHWSLLMLFLLFLALCFLKIMDLIQIMLGAYIEHSKKLWIKILCQLSQLIILSLCIYVNVFVGTFIAFICLVIAKYYFNSASKVHIFRWNDMIKYEKERLMVLYRFINLFTDVPQIVGQTKRRKIFDFMLPKTKNDPYLYLYSRSFIRQSGFSGMFVRLLCLASIIILFSTNLIFSFLIICMFIYLIGFQLFGLYFTFDDNVFIYIYPVSESQKKVAFVKLIRKMLYGVWAILNVLALIKLGFKASFLLIPFVSFVEIYVIVGYLLTNYLKKKA